MRIDVFYRRFNADRARMLSERNEVCVGLELPAGAGLLSIHRAVGSIGRRTGIAGVYEVQTDEGIWSRDGFRTLWRLDGSPFGDTRFDTWEQLEAPRFDTWEQLEASERASGQSAARAARCTTRGALYNDRPDVQYLPWFNRWIERERAIVERERAAIGGAT